MTRSKAPEKLPNLLEKIRECIEQEKYIFTNHALDRVKERGIDIQTTVNVLYCGYEEKKKTKFDIEKKFMEIRNKRNNNRQLRYSSHCGF